MVAALFSSILQLLDIVVAEDKKQKGILVVVVEEFEVVPSLRSKLKEIIDVLEDTDKRLSTTRLLGDIIGEITDAAYDLVDVLDDLITKFRINGNLKQKVGSYFTGKVVTPHDLAFKLMEIYESLDLMESTMRTVSLGLGIEMGTASPDLPISFKGRYRRLVEHITAGVHGSGLIGRHQVMEDIECSLVYGSTEEQRKLLKTISVVGMGGVGKTAIAEHVYHKVQQDFDYRIWVCVSNVFDEINVAKAIIAEVEHVAEDSLDSLPLATLRERIRRSIRGKKFFLVLDDVWIEDMQHWEGLIQTLKHGAPGSRILLTTRKDTVANMMKDSCVFHLEPLSDDHCWMLLSGTAFYGKGEQERLDLEDIGIRISKKCKGLPLAAITLGRLLKFKCSKEEWEKILNNEIWRSDIEHQKDFVSLLLSYYDLPLPLRECFKYCAVFPKGFVYDGETIIYHWMAHGYLGWENGEDLELKGREYISYLAARSFFQDFLLDTDGLKSTWKMHDIMHDFALFLMIKDGIVIDEVMNPGGNSIIDLSSTKARYLTALIPEGCCLPTSICGAEKLHSLVIISGENAITNEAVRIIFDQAKRLRLVDFGCHNALVDTVSLENLPDEIGNLIHLRHINLGGSKIKGLPKSLCELFNLQYLNLHNCESLEKLPDEIGNLINLRCINLGGSKIKRLPRSFYELHNLQYLNLGNCEAVENLPYDIRSLTQLKHINLSGSKIKGLPRCLCELHNLQYLNLNSCEALEYLPDEIGKLINLEYLGTLHCYKLACYPKSARRLTNLRRLRGIVLRADRNDPKEFTLGDFENLNCLRELSIVLKGNAVDDKELKRAKFENKTDLSEFNVE